MTRPDFEETFGVNAAYAEKVYGDYLAAPDTVPEEWRRWFETTLPEEQRAQPGARTGSAKPAPASIAPSSSAAARAAAPADADAQLQPLGGIAARIVANMQESLSVPTATSVREVPVKVLEENRHILNRHQQGMYLPKVSFTHLIAFAARSEERRVPAMAGSFVQQGGKPFRRVHSQINLGIA